MALERYHQIWSYARLIKDPALGMLVTKIIDEYSDKFFLVPIPGLSSKTARWSGWYMVRDMCEAIDKIQGSIGKPPLDYDKLYAMAIISLCGMGDYVSSEEKDDYSYHSKSESYRSNAWHEWNQVWADKVFEMGKELGVNIVTNRDIFRLISNINCKVKQGEVDTLSREAIILLTIYSLTIKY